MTPTPGVGFLPSLKYTAMVVREVGNIMKRARTGSKLALAGLRVERRQKRSQQLAQALQFQLDACREEGRLDTLLVSDDWGLCVAESPAGGRGAELAACLPPAARCGLAGVATKLPGGLGQIQAMAFQRLTIGSSKLFVCAVGGQPEKRAASLVRVEAGFRRILTAS
jgi:hypothetical protein